MITKLLATALVSVLILSGCGDDDVATTGEPEAATPTTAAPTENPGSGEGIVAVSLEPVDGIFIEGFEIGLRFETADGERLAGTLWSDFVTANGSGSAQDYYDSVLEQVVPAGDIVVLATVNVGMGPPPVTPDIEGDLICRLEIAVPADARVDVQVDFSGKPNCLTIL